MRKLLSTIAFFLLIPAGVAMAMNAIDKKDDKKDKDKEGDKHEPVIIIIWESAWSPVMRAIPLQDAINNCYSAVENEE